MFLFPLSKIKTDDQYSPKIEEVLNKMKELKIGLEILLYR